MSARPDTATAAAPGTSRIQRIARIVLVVVATLLLIVASVGYWLKSTVLDSDEFSEKVSSVLRTPEAANRFGDVLATQALSSGAVEARIREALPENAAFATVLLESEIRDLLARLFSEIFMRERVQDTVEAAILRLHTLVVSTLEGRRERLNVEGDSLVIDLNAVVQNVFDRLGVAPPERFEGRDVGEIVLVEDASALDQAATFVRAIDEGVPIVFVGSLLAYAGAVMLWRPRTRGLEAAGIGVIVAGVVGLLAWRIGDWGVSQFLTETPVARRIVEALLSNMRWQSLAIAVVGGAIVIGADQRSREWIARNSASLWERVERFGAGRAALIAAAVAVFLLFVL